MPRFLFQSLVFLGAVTTTVASVPAGDRDSAGLAATVESEPFRRAAYRLVRLLRRDVVQQDLGIDAGQQASLAELIALIQMDRRAAAKIREPRPARTSEDEVEREPNATRVERLIEYHSRITQILTPAQLARLKQIYWRALGPAVLNDNEIAAALGLTGDQQMEIGRLAATLREAEARRAEKEYLAEHPAPDGFVVYRATSEYKQRSFERLCELLDDGQRTKLQELLGAPCQGAETPVPLYEVLRSIPRSDPDRGD